jgi:transcriptional regulator of acetoin/glycerol metabolism
MAGKNIMLVDQENETLGELEVEEAKINEIPEKYRSKSLEEVVRMHQEAEKYIGKQAQEVGEVRKLADELIKQNLSPKQQPVEEEPEVDFFENPQKAVQNTIDRHPDVVKARQAAVDFNKMQMQQKLTQQHPDFVQVANDQGFVDWVKQSPVRLGLYAKADGEFDYDSANELLTTYKELKGVKARQTDESSRQVRSQALKAATVDTGGTGESGKRVYRRADLIRLKMTDPNRYDALSDEIMAAYADGRVK